MFFVPHARDCALAMALPVMLAALLPVAVGCSTKSDEAAQTADAGDAASGVSGGVLVAARPYTLTVPSGYVAATPTPLVVVLHGYGATGALESAYLNLGPAAEAKTYLYAFADGTLDKSGKEYWNATDACCDFQKAPVDDVAYLTAVMDDVAAHYNVDASRIYVVGHSNGAFMAYRLACDVPRVAAIVSLAGAVWEDATRCAPEGPVSILQVHGDADDTILYPGGTTASSGGAPYPSAHQTVATWAAKDRCAGALTKTGNTLSIDNSQPQGATLEEAYQGCPSGIDVTLWTMHGSGHIPSLAPSWGASVLDFLAAHPKR